MGWRIALTKQAERDLESIVAFLATRSSAAAERIGLELVELMFSLADFPRRGAVVRARPTLRKQVRRHYLVIYRVNETAQVVEIVRLWDARRDPDRLRLPG